MIVRLLPNPMLDHLGVIAAQQGQWLGQPMAHVEAFYTHRTYGDPARLQRGFVLQRIEDGRFVAPPGQQRSYTSYLSKARIYRTRAEADRDRCGNERAIPLSPEQNNASHR